MIRTKDIRLILIKLYLIFKPIEYANKKAANPAMKLTRTVEKKVVLFVFRKQIVDRIKQARKDEYD